MQYIQGQYCPKKQKSKIMANMNAVVQPIVHEDVRGNKLLYLKIQAASGEVLVNIGQKTYDAVTKAILPRETATQLNILPPEQNKPK